MKLRNLRSWRDASAFLGLLTAASGLTYVMIAYPWFDRVECLRSGPWNTLKTITSVGQLGTWLPYMVMPIVLTVIWRQVRALVPAGLLVRYGAFILSCGLTHLAAFAMLFTPYYWIAAKLEVLTAAISVAVMVETVARKRQILALVGSSAALAREAETARRAEVKLSAANQALAEINAKLEDARQREAERAREEGTRAERAEGKNVDLEGMVRRLQAQDAALATLESPILEALDGVLVSVLVGALSSERARTWTERLTAEVFTSKARAVVVDVTGLLFVDTAVAGAILRTIRCVRIVGARCVLTGVRPEVGQTLVGLGVDLGDVPTLGTLRRGLELAGRWAGER